MNSILRTTVIILISSLLASCTVTSDLARTGTSGALQYDFDIARLNHLEKISSYIEEYKRITGKYPLQGQSTLQHYVLIATQEQQKYTTQRPPYPHDTTDATSFIAELQSKLGNDIQIPFDPQRAPVNKPNFYIYMIEGDTYYLAIHVHQDFIFANKLGSYYNKIEVTNNISGNRKGTWLRESLISHPDFISAKNAIPNKPGYTEMVIKKLGGNSAF